MILLWILEENLNKNPVQLPAQHPLVVAARHHQVSVLTELHGVHAAVVGQQVLKKK